MRFICQIPEARGSCFDQRVQVPGRLAENLHRDCIRFGLVLDLAECIDAVPEDVLAAAQVPGCIRDGYAQLVIRLRVCLGSGLRGCHGLGILPQCLLNIGEIRIDQLRSVCVFLQRVRGQPCDH